MNTLSDVAIRTAHPTQFHLAFARGFSVPLPCCLLPVAVPGLMELLARNMRAPVPHEILVRAE